MQSVAIPFVVYQTTNSEAWLGISAFTGLFSAMLANTPGGMLADRYSRRLVLGCTQLLQMASALSLWALWQFGSPSIATLFPLLIIGSIGGGLNMPVWQSFIPGLVEPSEIPLAIRLNSMQFAVARAIGPVIGAITLKVYGPATCFMANAVSFLVIIGVLATVPDGAKPKDRQPLRLAKAIEDTVDGWKYLAAHPGLKFAPIAVFVNAAFGFGITTLAPAFARDQFLRSASDNGTLVGLFGLGGVIGVFAIGTFFRGLPNSLQVRTALTAGVIGNVILVFTHSFTLGGIAFVVVGFMNSVGATALNTSVQMQVDDVFRGRVMAAYMQMFFLGSALGSLFLGVVSEVFSLSAAAAVSAVAFVGFHAWAAFRFDGLRVLDPVAR